MTKYLILGAGVSGLSFAEQLNSDEYVILEKEDRVGGYCKTTLQNGFVWDYAGHFFHFQSNELRNEFIEKIGVDNIKFVKKNTKIFYKGNYIDYPFQKNIHQLEKEEFIDCLYDLYFCKPKEVYSSFLEMLYSKFGVAIVEKFLKPYNEKLYACDLNLLEVDSMGRFFPNANVEDIILNMKESNNESYNNDFIYPQKGAEEFIKAIEVDTKKIFFNVDIKNIDIENKIVYTDNGNYQYEVLINTLPFNVFCQLTNIDVPLDWNKVLVFNIGFGQKTNITDIHWIYVPDKEINFYRVGFYDNILSENQGSIYVEIGFDKNDKINIENEFEKTLSNLKKMGIISKQKVKEWQYIIMNPAYVHIENTTEIDKIQNKLENKKVFSIGRYGKWTYCSIEDCIFMARKLYNKINHNKLGA